MQIGGIRIQCADVSGIDRQAAEPVRRATRGKIGEIARQQIGIGAEQVCELARGDDGFEIGLQEVGIDRVVIARQAASRKEGRVGVEGRCKGREVGRNGKTGEIVWIPARADESEIIAVEGRQIGQETFGCANSRQRGQIGPDRVLVERGVGAGDAAVFEIGVIARQCFGITAEDVGIQPCICVDRTTALKEGEIIGEKRAAFAQETVERTCRRELGEIGIEHFGIAAE